MARHSRRGRLTIDEFRLNPQNAAADPMLDYPWSVTGGGLRGTGVLGDRPYVVRLDLNEWFRFDRPGTFRLSVRSKRVADQAAPTYTIVPIESNSESFRISPRDAAWEASELETARRLADAKGLSVDSQKS